MLRQRFVRSLPECIDKVTSYSVQPWRAPTRTCCRRFSAAAPRWMSAKRCAPICRRVPPAATWCSRWLPRLGRAPTAKRRLQCLHAAGSELARGQSVDRYVIAERLGAGGMGVVYRAYDPELDRKVALKLIRRAPGPDDDRTIRELQERLLREAQAMARITHPNVIAVYDVGRHGDDVFVAMELVDGETLAMWLTKARTPSEIARIFVRAGRGLAAAHAAGLVHRDFKPNNVMIGHDGRVRVLDFGLARRSARCPMRRRHRRAACMSRSLNRASSPARRRIWRPSSWPASPPTRPPISSASASRSTRGWRECGPSPAARRTSCARRSWPARSRGRCDACPLGWRVPWSAACAPCRRSVGRRWTRWWPSWGAIRRDAPSKSRACCWRRAPWSPVGWNTGTCARAARGSSVRSTPFGIRPAAMPWGARLPPPSFPTPPPPSPPSTRRSIAIARAGPMRAHKPVATSKKEGPKPQRSTACARSASTITWARCASSSTGSATPTPPS